MNNILDDVIAAYVRNQSESSLEALHTTFMRESLLVPVAEPVKELEPDTFDVPVICVRTEVGAGAIPSFTSLEHLLNWKPAGCLYTSLTGRSLLGMAVGMDSISEILVNPNDVPRGRIPRGDFKRMLALK